MGEVCSGQKHRPFREHSVFGEWQVFTCLDCEVGGKVEVTWGKTRAKSSGH